MYEATICAPINNDYLLEYVERNLLPCRTEMGGIIVDHIDDYRKYYALSCCDTYAPMIKRMIVDSVSEVLCVGYKNIYLRELLDIQGYDFYTDILINTMCLFDSRQDKLFVSKVINPNKPIYLDGYYNFLMKEIKLKWKEICTLLEENYYIVGDKELTVEFLQYLLQSMDNRCGKFSVLIEDDQFFLFGADNRIIKPIYCIGKSNSIEEQIMQNVLYKNPKKVTVYSKKKLSEQFVTTIEKLFDCSFVVQ